jgi:ribosomal protein L29
MVESAKADLEIEQVRFELSSKRLSLIRLRVELGKTEVSSLTVGEIDHDIQRIETYRREEQRAYLMAQSALSGDNL